jgi:hypothetical protein
MYQKEYQQVGERNLPGFGEVHIFEHPKTKTKVYGKVMQY